MVGCTNGRLEVNSRRGNPIYPTPPLGQDMTQG